MNGSHHGDLTAIACKLAGISDDVAAPIIHGAANADYLPDVLASVPFEGERPRLVGRTLTSLQHFQRPDGSGYYWDADRSLGPLEELGEVATHLARTTMSGTSEPMQSACLVQQGRVLGDFRFPSAARVGSYYARAPFGGEDTGRALHMVQDACVPHHAWGVLLWGHQEWENECQAAWVQYREMAQGSRESQADMISAIRAECIDAGTVEDVIRANAAWTLRWFGQSHRQEECSVTDCLAACIGAVASSIRALGIMRG